MQKKTTISRRSALALGAATGIAAIAPYRARAQAPKEVKIAMLVPLSGPWARTGILEQMGAEMAIEDINNAGGIKSLGGAKMKLMQFDAGDSSEKAKNAAQRMVAQEPDLVGGFGAWLSSFTLAVTEVTERADLPWLTLSYSDLITGRGFKYVFQTAPTAAAQAESIVPTIMELAEKTTGKRPTKIAMIGDNTASSDSFFKPIRDHVLAQQKLTAVVDQIYTPPLSDATTLIQPIRSARPDFVLLQSTNAPDDKLLMDKFAEYGLSGGKLPLIGGGGHFATPELLQTTGADILQGLFVGLANWPGKAQAELAARFIARTKEPWFGHDSIFAYAHTMILKEALERAGVADRHKVAEAIRAMDMRDGPAKFYPGSHLKFDETGKRVDAQLVVVQWQNGKPVTVFPKEIAAAEPIWGKG
jgi:branched-chain amino acid transport system substrate-binding protein